MTAHVRPSILASRSMRQDWTVLTRKHGSERSLRTVGHSRPPGTSRPASDHNATATTMLRVATSPHSARLLTSRAHRCRFRYSTEALEQPPPAGGHLPSVANSSILRTSRDSALRAPGLKFADDEPNSLAGRETRRMNLYQAVRDAMSIALAKDDTAVVFGEDVAFGGVFRCTMGLAEEFGRERVFNTPLSEQGIAGFGIGLAAMGQTAIAEIQFADYIYPAFDQLVNEAAKFRYRSGGQFNAGGLTVRTPTMSVGHGGLYHSQSPEGYFMGAAGLKIVIPRSPIQAKGLLLASIRDPNPIIFMEPKILYRSSVEHVPTSDYTLPLSILEPVLPQTNSDITVLSWGTPVYTCETAAHMLAGPPEGLEGIVPKSVRGAKVEVLDLRTVLPWDIEGVLERVGKSGRLVVVHEAGVTGGVGAEIAATVQRELFLKLKAPVRRVGSWDTPSGLNFEKFILPDAVRVLDAIIETLTF
ncbi:pyruvate dehydrogenase [Peniophora sp. CONT]|nr:pyruvate dehydrogenase [Peniophora sp. CONT]